jgi:YNFM family putative membrane transporter
MREIIFLLALASANSGISLRAVEPMLPRLATDFGVSVSVAASVITAYALAAGIGYLATGPIGDRFGKLRVVTITLFAAGITSVACAFAQDITTLAVMRFATGMLCTTPVMLGMAYIGDRVPSKERQPVIARFIAGTITGQALGPVVGGALTDLFGWHGAFVFLGGVFMVVAAILFVRTRAQWDEEAPVPLPRNPVKTYVQMFSVSRVRHVVSCGFIETMLFFAAYSFLGAALALRFDASLTLIGLVLAGFGVGGVLYTLFVRRLLMAFGQRGMVVGGGALCFVSFVVIALTPVFWVALPCAMGLGFAFYMLHNTLQTKATEMMPAARATALSLYSFSWVMGQALGVTIMGVAVVWLGYALPIIASGAGLLALGWWLRNNLQKL